MEMMTLEKTIESAFEIKEAITQTDTQRTVSFNLDIKMDTERTTSLAVAGSKSEKSVSFSPDTKMDTERSGSFNKRFRADTDRTDTGQIPMNLQISNTKTADLDRRFRTDTDRTYTGHLPHANHVMSYKNNQSLTVPAPRKLTNQSSIVQSVRKSFRKIGALITQKSKSKTLEVSRKNTPSASRGTDERGINGLYIQEWKETERAKALEVGEFVTLVAESINEILGLNYQSVARFKRSKRFVKFRESANLEQLIAQYGDKGVYD